jgi:hypothetical protein
MSARIKISDFTAEPDSGFAAVKSLYRTDAAFAFANQLPDFINITAKRCDDGRPGDNNPSAVH